MDIDLNGKLDSIGDGIRETADIVHVKTSGFHEKYISKMIPDCGKYGDAAKFAAEMIPGVSEYNAIKDGDWQAFAIAAGTDIAGLAIGGLTAGAGYAAVKGGTSAAKTGVKAAVKEIAAAGAKKAAKETAETGAKKAVKEAVETGAEKAVKEAVETGAKKAAKEAAEESAKKAAKETAEAGAAKAAMETTEAGVKKTVRESAESGAKTAIKEAVEKAKEGGSYRDLKKMGYDGTVYEIHHMPAKASSFLDEMDGPAIKMEKLDHRKTAGCGSSADARAYQQRQRELIENGRFREAVEMDIEDIKSKFPGKYDDAIKELREYVDKLEAEGII